MLCLNVVQHGRFGIDKIFIIKRASQQGQGVSRFCNVIVMKGKVVYCIVALVHNLCFPFRIVVHKGSRRATDNSLDTFINPLHGLGSLVAESAVTCRIFFPGAQLPVAVHLVTKTPGFYFVRLGVSVLLAQVGPVGSAFVICIFNAVHCILQSSGSKVYCINWRGANLFGPLKVFVMANIIRDILMPGRIQVSLAAVTRTNRILPLPG